MKIKNLSWDEIYPVWRDHLWPGRVSSIEPTSAIKYLGGYDMDNMIHRPVFYGIEEDEKLVGVNSVTECSDGSYRSRGLWVDPNYRNKGYAKLLLEYGISIAGHNHVSYIWSMPRHSALPAYLSAGFQQTSEWFDKDVEFGPNCFVRKDL